MNTLTTIGNGDLTIGQVANIVASRHVFIDYVESKAANTKRRHKSDLALFSEYLTSVGNIEALDNPSAWAIVTWGLVEGFKRWLLSAGYSIASVNAALSTVKTYSALANKAGAIDGNEARLIASIRGYSHKDGKHLDEVREVTRIGYKKPQWVNLSKDQAIALKTQPDSPQGRRDALLMHLLLNHGLRCGEVAALEVTSFDLQNGLMVFYRQKVDKWQTHRLTQDTLNSARAYFANDALANGPLLRGSRKDGRLHEAGMSEQAITARVKTLGKEKGIEGLSAHDCRHYWVTTALQNGTQVDRLQQAGGWNSPAMPLKYASQYSIANEGVVI